MEFAKRELEKYGWTEGCGLGKNENGIVEAIKPKLKFDNAGLGHDISEEYSNSWWQNLYDEASRNIVTAKENNEIVIKVKNAIAHNKKKKTKKHDLNCESMKYKGFIKTSELSGANEKRLCKSKIDNEPEVSNNKIVNEEPGLLNEELFKLCGGRTAHKGARHGLKMSAKLARIEEQEKNLMKSAENILNKDRDFCDINLKKKKKKFK